MKSIRKFAEFVGYTLYHGERFNEWRCPNKKCGFSVSEDYTCCPYCGQKIKFKEPPKVKMIKISMEIGREIEMDFFNKNRVAELERIIEMQERELENYRKESESQNSGKHKTGAWCHGCKNLVVHSDVGCFPYQFCMLDNECKDRKE